MKIVLPMRGELGMKTYWHAPAVHAIEGPKVVYIEEGEQALYPSATSWIEVARKEDGKRRNNYKQDAEFLERIESAIRANDRTSEIVKPDAKWPKKRFIPQPHVRSDIKCDVVVCPRRRLYGSEKNWPEWFDLTARLKADGLEVFAAGAADSSYQVPCERAWDYKRPLDAAIEAMHSAKLVVATDAGLAHLAVLCGRPLFLITHGRGLVAPGPSIDETGRHMDDRFWPVKLERYEEANHTKSEIRVLHDAWYNPDFVLDAVVGAVL